MVASLGATREKSMNAGRARDPLPLVGESRGRRRDSFIVPPTVQVGCRHGTPAVPDRSSNVYESRATLDGMRVLVVEDELRLANTLRLGLEEEGSPPTSSQLVATPSPPPSRPLST